MARYKSRTKLHMLLTTFYHKVMASTGPPEGAEILAHEIDRELRPAPSVKRANMSAKRRLAVKAMAGMDMGEAETYLRRHGLPPMAKARRWKEWTDMGIPRPRLRMPKGTAKPEYFDPIARQAPTLISTKARIEAVLGDFEEL
jgi:hypothetical protein